MLVLFTYNRKQYKVINSCKGSICSLDIIWRILNERNQTPLNEFKYRLELPLRYWLFGLSLVSVSEVHTSFILRQTFTDFNGLLDWAISGVIRKL